MWRIGRVLAVAGTMLFVAGAVAAYAVYTHVTQPGTHGEAVVFTVPEGSTGREVAHLLAEEGFVEHPFFFRLAMRLAPSTEPIKHGVHLVPLGASPMEVLAIVRQRPEPRLNPNAIKVTIPEGLTIAQLAEMRDDPVAFMEAVMAVSPREALDVDVPSLEGFLMPNTYYFDEPPTPEELVQRMLEQFKTEYAALASEHPTTGDLLELVTVASLVEEEARVDEERAVIAAVIYNRLAKGRALQFDSTLQYALNKYGERLLNEDKQVDSPYNTYKYPGLPPGPISNPGVASLRAAMAPADVEYLYFVSNADGRTHTFSRTMREHEQAVARYRREIREQRRALQPH